MADLKTLFPEASDSERQVLRNVDLLVGLGVPREIAERAARRAIFDLEKVLDALEAYDGLADFKECQLTKALFIGGLCNWADDMSLRTEIAMKALIELYRRGA